MSCASAEYDNRCDNAHLYSSSRSRERTIMPPAVRCALDIDDTEVCQLRLGCRADERMSTNRLCQGDRTATRTGQPAWSAW
jgi:hypothetical protein